jgi:hypothetical protein
MYTRINAGILARDSPKKYERDVIFHVIVGKLAEGCMSSEEKQMINEPIPHHVFVSYSRTDQAIVETIITALQNKGITIWIDRTGLLTGTPNWNTAIRDALRNSFAVLFMASPHAGQSNAVLGELTVARDLGCQIYPLWIASDRWSECAPVEMLYTQRIDCRGDSYDSGLTQVTRELHELIANRLPKHCLYTGEYLRSLQEFRLPSDYLLIYLDEPHFFFHRRGRELEISLGASPRNSGDVVIILPQEYRSIRLLLDDLYMEYLRARYKPYTYGLEWILAIEQTGIPQKQLIVPWEWLVGPADRPLASYYPEWKDASPGAYGFSPGQELIIMNGPFESAFGVATNDNLVAEILADNTRAHDKEKYTIFDYLWRRDVLTPYYLPRELAHIRISSVLPNAVNTSEYSYLCIFMPCLFGVGKAAFIIE